MCDQGISKLYGKLENGKWKMENGCNPMPNDSQIKSFYGPNLIGGRLEDDQSEKHEKIAKNGE